MKTISKKLTHLITSSPVEQRKCWRGKGFGTAGNYFGYPQCCIDEFMSIYYKNSTRHKICLLAAAQTGFIPCYNHSCKILCSDITLTELIKNRKCMKPFKDAPPHRNRERSAVQSLIMMMNE